jgi:serine/threonine protein kinase
MQPRLLNGQNAKYFFFPDNKDWVLGGGKSAIVFLGAEINTKTKVVIKQLASPLLSDDITKKKFSLEAAFSIQHNSFAKNIDFIVENDNIFIVQQYIPGPTLKDLITNRKYYSYKNNPLFISIIIKSLEALGHLHAQNLCHCDIKPSNIIIYAPYDDIDQNNPEIKIIDYRNLKKCFDTDDINSMYQNFDIQYASPEQLFGYPELIGPHSDIFQIGLILFEAIAKETPLKIANSQMYRRLQTVVPIKKHYRFSDDLFEIITKSTAKPHLLKSERYYTDNELKILIYNALTKRYQNTKEFCDDLRKIS